MYFSFEKQDTLPTNKSLSFRISRYGVSTKEDFSFTLFVSLFEKDTKVYFFVSTLRETSHGIALVHSFISFVEPLGFHRYEPVFFNRSHLLMGQKRPISTLPLTTSHPRLLPQTWVRSSKRCYPFFNLLMARSPGFGSNKCNL